MSPPKKRAWRPEPHATFETSLSRKCQFQRSSLVWSGWQREAARLFTEFWRSGRREHLNAFSRHVAAMRQQLR
jgi:hypothetical protein